jgi:hypothetical protein
MSTNQSTLEVVGARTIDQIRKDGLDKQLKERIAAERAEMQRIKEQAKMQNSILLSILPHSTISVHS